MQRAVERDSKNRSNYAMCAVNPSRISNTFSDAALHEVIDSIALLTGSLFEIVNYNVEVLYVIRLDHLNADFLSLRASNTYVLES
jgi:malonyl CoA-acyl carrier protein transacylase